MPELPAVDPATGTPVTLRALTVGDVDDMLALVALTEPGPFGRRTIELGGHVGILHGDRMMAMAGQRLRPPGYCEVSAVCTHPYARRRGYASIVTAHGATAIAACGETPILHLAATKRRRSQRTSNSGSRPDAWSRSPPTGYRVPPRL